MEIESKKITIVILITLLLISSVGNVILTLTSGGGITLPNLNVLRYADTESGAPNVLDPVDSWDSVSNDVIRHVCDNLWYYDLYDPDFALEMRLATSYKYNVAKDEVEVILREGVYYHDGSYFNATAVKFTFDRILYLVNATKQLTNETVHLADPASLFYNMVGEPILNKTEINSEYNVTFYLNAPSGIFIPLLTYDACAILHPDSTPAKEYLVLWDDILVGTGPFEYAHLIPGEEMKFVRNKMYWGPSVFWDEVIWIYYSDAEAAANAMLGGEVDAGGFLFSRIDEFINDPEIVYTNLESSIIFRYWGINNKKINETLIRKAMAYAYNYSYFIKEIRQGFAIRAQQFLPPGFPYHNETFKAPYLNISIAREAMKLARPTETSHLTAQDYGVNVTNDVAWEDLDVVRLSVFSYEYSFEFAADMDKIGIEIHYYDPFYCFEPWECWDATLDPNLIEIYYMIRRLDYLDPYSMIKPLFSNTSSATDPQHSLSLSFNYLQLDDPAIMGWLADYEQETDEGEKTKLLYKIQNRIINELYVLLPLSFDVVIDVHHKSIGNPCVNIMNSMWFRDSYFIPGVLRA